MVFRYFPPDSGMSFTNTAFVLNLGSTIVRRLMSRGAPRIHPQIQRIYYDIYYDVAKHCRYVDNKCYLCKTNDMAIRFIFEYSQIIYFSYGTTDNRNPVLCGADAQRFETIIQSTKPYTEGEG